MCREKFLGAVKLVGRKSPWLVFVIDRSTGEGITVQVVIARGRIGRKRRPHTACDGIANTEDTHYVSGMSVCGVTVVAMRYLASFLTSFFLAN